MGAGFMKREPGIASDVTVTSTSYANGGLEPNLLLYNATGSQSLQVE